MYLKGLFLLKRFLNALLVKGSDLKYWLFDVNKPSFVEKNHSRGVFLLP
jgi:hypothetical protein